jgi:hypothetical protein
MIGEFKKNSDFIRRGQSPRLARGAGHLGRAALWLAARASIDDGRAPSGGRPFRFDPSMIGNLT